LTKSLLVKLLIILVARRFLIFRSVLTKCCLVKWAKYAVRFGSLSFFILDLGLALTLWATLLYHLYQFCSFIVFWLGVRCLWLCWRGCRFPWITIVNLPRNIYTKWNSQLIRRLGAYVKRLLLLNWGSSLYES